MGEEAVAKEVNGLSPVFFDQQAEQFISFMPPASKVPDNSSDLELPFSGGMAHARVDYLAGKLSSCPLEECPIITSATNIF